MPIAGSRGSVLVDMWRRAYFQAGVSVSLVFGVHILRSRWSDRRPQTLGNHVRETLHGNTHGVDAVLEVKSWDDLGRSYSPAWPGGEDGSGVRGVRSMVVRAKEIG
jgi:hypothetical protein